MLDMCFTLREIYAESSKFHRYIWVLLSMLFYSIKVALQMQLTFSIWRREGYPAYPGMVSLLVTWILKMKKCLCVYPTRDSNIKIVSATADRRFKKLHSNIYHCLQKSRNWILCKIVQEIKQCDCHMDFGQV